MRSSKSPGCSSPSHFLSSHPHCHTVHLSILDGARKNWDSLAASCTAGEVECSLTCSQFPYGRNHGLQRSLWVLNCATLGRDNISKVKPFFLLSSMYPISLLFCSNGVLELLCWTPELPQKHCYPWVIVKISVVWGQWGGMIENLFFHFNDISSQVLISLFLQHKCNIDVACANEITSGVDHERDGRLPLGYGLLG